MKKILVTLFFSMLTICSWAYVVVDDFCYELNDDTKEATVVKNSNSQITGDIVIPASITVEGVEYSVTSIDNNAFYSCVEITSVVIPNSVKSIGDYAFTTSGLTSVTIGNSVETIGTRAFAHNSQLTSVIIPKSVKSIGEFAFGRNLAMTSMTVEEGNSVYDSRENCNAIIETATNTLVEGCQTTVIPNTVERIGNMAFSYRETLTEITIPESVVSIGDYAFSLTGLTSVVIPGSVKSIGSNAFGECYHLVSATLPEGLETIGDQAFNRCGELSSVNIPKTTTSMGTAVFSYDGKLSSIEWPESLTSIPESTFSNCSFVSFVIPNTVTSIGSNAFARCWDLVTVDLPEGLENIGSSAFYGCYQLTAVTIPETVTKIGGHAFENCYNLTTVNYNAKNAEATDSSAPILSYAITTLNIGDAVETIPAYLAYNCSYLPEVTIPASVTKIGEQAFASTGLKDVTVEWNTPLSVPSNTFYYTQIDRATLHVPAGTADKYCNAEVWMEFGTKKEYDAPNGIETIYNENETIRKHIENGSIVIMKNGEKYAIDGKRIY